MHHEFGICGRAHHFGEFGPVRNVNRLGTAMRFRRRRAPPHQVVPAGTPAAPVVFGDGDDENLRLIGPLDPVEGASDGQLPADVGFCLEWMAAGLQRQAVQRAADTARETRPVQENARAVDAFRAPLTVFDFGNAALSLLVVLPGLGIEFGGELAHALFVFSTRIERTVAAATVVGAARHDTVAAGAEDATPSRGQPGEVAAVDLLVVGGINELDPVAGEVERSFGEWLGRCGSDDRATGR